MSGASSAISARPGERVLGRSGAVDEPDRHRRRVVELLAGQQHPPRRPAAGEQGQPAHGPRVDGEPEGRRREPEDRAVGADAQVGGDRELRPRTDGRAVHGRDDRDGDGHDPLQHRVERVEEPRVADGVEVRPGAERGALARQHHHPGPAGDGVVERGVQVAAVRGVERVAPVVARDPQLGDGAVRVGLDHEAAVCPRASA